MTTPIEALQRQIDELNNRLRLLELGERPNQATDTTSDVLFTSVTATGRIETSHGTWTPAFVGTGTAGTFTYTVQLGRYIKVGSLVWIDFQVHISVVTVAATGNLTITGLPFTSVTATNYHVVIPLAADDANVLATTVQLTGRIASNVSIIDFIETGDDIVATSLGGGAIRAGSTMIGSCVYEAA